MKEIKKTLYLFLAISVVLMGCGSGDVGDDSAKNPTPTPSPVVVDPEPEPDPEPDDSDSDSNNEESYIIVKIDGTNVYIDNQELEYTDYDSLKESLEEKLIDEETIVLSADNGDRSLTKKVKSFITEMGVSIEEENNVEE